MRNAQAKAKKAKTAMKASVAIAMFAALAACGGGGGSDSSVPANTTTNTNTPTVSGAPVTVLDDGKLHAACTSCGAVNDSTYSGAGVGLWQAINATNSSESLPLSIAGLANKKVTLVFSNQNGANASMQSIAVNASMLDAIVHGASSTSSGTTVSEDPRVAAIHAFNSHGFAAIADVSPIGASAHASQLVPQPNFSAYVVGATRSFNDSNAVSHNTTLEAQSTTTDGTTVNIWVETTEFATGKVTASIVNTLMTNYAGANGVYSMVTGVGGKLYGPNNVPGTISGTGQPIDLVVLNITPDSTPYGIVGYFYGLNDYLSSTAGAAASNQSISLYLDSETLYLGGAAGMRAMQTVMAHESTHMQNFFRRQLTMGSLYAYDTWLEEMTAMMMEDWVSFNIDATYNAIRDNRFIDFMTYAGQGSYGCGLTTWTPMATTCDSYATNGSFGGYLNRQVGLTFYKTLLTDFSVTGSVATLNDAISKTRSGATMQQLYTDFAVASEGVVPASSGLSTYGFPARAEGGFTLPVIDPTLYTRDLPATSPTLLAPYASLPVQRSNVTGTYQETVNIPAGVTLSVIIQ